MSDNSKPIILAENIYELGTPTATDTDTDTDYSALHIKDRRTYTCWKAASAGTKYLTINAGSAVTADALGIIGHNLATVAAAVSVECSSDNFSADTTEALAAFTPATDKAILKIFTSKEKQYWRITLAGCTAAPMVAVVFLGDRVTFPRYPSGNFDPFPEEIVSESNRGKTGHLLGSVIRYISAKISVSFRQILPAWIESDFRPLWDDYLSQLYPVFWAWEVTNHPSDVYFVKVPDNFRLMMPFDPYRRSISLIFDGVKE